MMLCPVCRAKLVARAIHYYGGEWDAVCPLKNPNYPDATAHPVVRLPQELQNEIWEATKKMAQEMMDSYYVEEEG